MKKNITITLLFVLLFAVVSVFVNRIEVAKALGSLLRSGTNLDTMRTNATTTLPNFLTTGTGTTTLTVPSDGLDSITAYVQIFASTTVHGLNPPALRIDRYASDDEDVFYGYTDSYDLTSSNLIGSSSVAVASTSVPLLFTPERKGATSTLSVDLRLTPARYTRFVFSLPTSTNMTTAYRDGMNLHVNLVGNIK